MSKTAAILETLKEYTMVNKMAAQRTIISTKAKSGDFKPKNIMDQRTLRASWTIKKIKAIF